MICRLRFAGSNDHLLRLRLKGILRPENIDRRNQTDDEVRNRLDDRHYRRRERGKNLLHIAQKARLDPVFHIALHRVERPLDIRPDFRIVFEHIDRPFFQTLIVFRCAVDDAHHTLIELRHQHREKRIDDERSKDERENERNTAADFIRLRGFQPPLFQQRPQPQVDKIDNRV